MERWLLCSLVMLVAVCLVTSAVTERRQRRVRSRNLAKCRGLARYNVTFIGLWSRDRFPKQYPLYRPHAQWTKVVGRTHSRRYKIFEVGQLCTEALKQFAELGSTTLYDKDTQGMNGVLDTFALPALDKDGVGSTSGRVIVDAKHQKVSLVVRIVPSPDWFVGVDSHSLCSSSGWVNSDTVDLYPYDAGTDMGFTFTAPNWPETPPKPIVQITSQKPSHAANSFYQPDLPKLPPMARLEFKKVGVYAVRNILEEDPVGPEPAARPTSAPLTTTTQRAPRVRWPTNNQNRNRNNNNNRQWWRQQQQNRKPLDDEADEESVDTEEAELDAAAAGVQDCAVGDWSEWGACSKSCGFGKRLRMRRVDQRPSAAGRPCPPLLEDELCGSMRSCNWNYFSKFDRSNVRRGV